MRPIGEKLKDPKWWGEQQLHAIAGFILSALVSYPLVFAGIGPAAELALVGQFVGGSAGAVREVWQNFRDDPADNDLVDSHIDAWAAFAGAFCASLVLVLLKT